MRDEELEELDHLLQDACMVPVAGGSENNYGKTNILLQAYVTRTSINNFSLISDSAYIAQVSKACIYLTGVSYFRKISQTGTSECP